MPAAKKSDTRPPRGVKSSDGSEPPARCRTRGWPTAPTPSSTASTKRGSSCVPNSGLKTAMQPGPQAGVAALAGGVATVPRPTTVVAAAAARTWILTDMRRSSRGGAHRSLRRAVVLVTGSVPGLPAGCCRRDGYIGSVDPPKRSSRIHDGS
jgi:hypothetical protein